ncbi:Protein-tyrosine-phosphatase [Paraburkholderia caribensis]|uniref:arsenate-mycothiol transferase ArsC n=1 Tax=Paraburkholderia caribensis TaxID=75105 RepID=UPI001CB40582|nr:protein tyrosine phosphatase [Paraburkholderia caribensis]CAG9190957.1 Protein-tyrosine-phosphatase [Paraburkholderia caribensis]
MTGCRVTRKQRVLFLCRDNATLSILAEALLRELDGSHFDAFSAGLEPADKVQAAAMGELRHGFSSLELLNPKSWLEFTSEWAPQMDFVVTLCDESARVDARAFHGAPTFRHWTLTPSAYGAAGAVENAFWQILKRVEDFIAAERRPWPSLKLPAVAGCTPDACDLLLSGQ